VSDNCLTIVGVSMLLLYKVITMEPSLCDSGQLRSLKFQGSNSYYLQSFPAFFEIVCA
jgi:hypothetical protein